MLWFSIEAGLKVFKYDHGQYWSFVAFSPCLLTLRHKSLGSVYKNTLYKHLGQVRFFFSSCKNNNILEIHVFYSCCGHYSSQFHMCHMMLKTVVNVFLCKSLFFQDSLMNIKFKNISLLIFPTPSSCLNKDVRITETSSCIMGTNDFTY